MGPLWRRLETSTYEEARQLTQNRLYERIQFASADREDVALMVERRLRLSCDPNAAVRAVCEAAMNHGGLKFAARVLREAGKLAGAEAADLETIRRVIGEADPPLRAEVARRVCDALGWCDTLGRPKLMSCRVGLLRLHRAGLIALPAARNGNGNGRGLMRQPAAWPAQRPLAGSAGQLAGLRLEPVADQAASRLWNGLIARWHYLGYRPLPGAQLRYLIEWEQGVLGALGFGAAAGRWPRATAGSVGGQPHARPIWGVCSTTRASSFCPGCR
jgi:hypothetical protein